MQKGTRRKKSRVVKRGVVAGKSKEDVFTALKLVLKKAQAHKGLSSGFNPCRKAIARDEVKLCLLTADNNLPDNVNQIKAFCTEHNVGLISVPNRMTLGELAGMCKFDAEGNATKVHPCTYLIVKDFGEDSEALHIVQKLLGL